MNGEQRKKLQDALINAFPTKPLLEQMLSFGLDKNLDAIAGGTDLQQIVFELIKKADAEQWIEELVRAARRSNPNNKNLLIIAQELLTITAQFVGDEEDYRRNLLRRVRDYWIKKVLEEDLLYNRIIIKLEIEERPDFIIDPWGKSQKASNQIKQGSFPLGIKGLIKRFNRMEIPRTLLILGEQEGGKTTILLMLTSYLIKHVNKNKDSKLPIPVVFDICKSNNQTLDFHDWFIDELCTKYKLPKEVANNLINNQQLLLVIDNLDKVDLDRQKLYIEALNKFTQNYRRTEIIATFNIKEYELIPDRLNFQSAIYIQRPTLRNVNKFFPKTPGTKDVLAVVLKAIKTLLRRCYLFLNNFSIVIIAMLFIFMILFIDQPVSEICKAKNEHNIIKETILRILRINKIFYETNKSYTGECFTDIVEKEQIPNGHFDYTGSTTWYAVNTEILSAINENQFLQFNLNYKGAIGSLAGIKKLLENDSDITFTLSSHDITLSDQQMAKNQGFELRSEPVAQDIILIVVNRDLFEQNIDFFKQGIDKEFIKSIYTAADKKNWNEIKGPNILITPYSRQDNSGTVEWFKEYFLEKEVSKNTIYIHETTESVKAIVKDKGGVFYGSAALLLPPCDVVPLSIKNEKNAIAPYKRLVDKNYCKNKSQRNQLNLEAIYNKQYPSVLIRKLYVVYKDEGDSKKAGSIFAKLLLTQQGQEIFEKNNFAKLQN